ncbi:MAG: histidine kinase [Flavisolibacter sp.]|jgi:CheY-like chemotaxis protein|nr:histidine kinase [Flavisolibacter sp.]
MSKQGPIILVEDDVDDREILMEIFESLNVNNSLKFFGDGQEVLDYLATTTDQPFIILTDVNLPKMRGTELLQRINENEYLRKKSIPFIFLTTSADGAAVQDAYDQMVQGFFQKEHRYEEVKNMIKLIIDYWMLCKHPNNVR